MFSFLSASRHNLISEKRPSAPRVWLVGRAQGPLGTWGAIAIKSTSIWKILRFCKALIFIGGYLRIRGSYPKELWKTVLNHLLSTERDKWSFQLNTERNTLEFSIFWYQVLNYWFYNVKKKSPNVSNGYKKLKIKLKIGKNYGIMTEEYQWSKVTLVNIEKLNFFPLWKHWM